MMKIYYVQGDGYYAAPDHEAFKLGLLDLVGQQQAEDDLREYTTELTPEDAAQVKVTMVDEDEVPTEEPSTLSDMLALHIEVKGLVFGMIASENW